MVAGRTSKYQKIQQRIGAQTVGPMHAYAGAFTHGIQAADRGVVIAALGHHNLAVDVGRNAAHLVVNRRHHGDRLLGDVHVGEVVADFIN